MILASGFRVLLAAIVAVASLACEAHKPSDSYLTLQASGSALQGRWDIAVRDLDFALGLDADGDGSVTWGELRARHAEIDAYALAHLSLRSDGEACPLSVSDHLVDEHVDGAYAVLVLTGSCPRDVRALRVGYGLFFDLDAQHRGLLRISVGGQEGSAVFSAQTPEQSFGTAGSRGRQFLGFVADGVKHIAIGFDHILFLVALLLPAVLVREGATWRPAGSLGVTVRNVVGIVTAFTIAHSITLSLATLGVVHLPSRLVESAIAASVLATALDNLVPFLPRRRWVVAFVFGLLHGFGFASVLLDLQLPASSLALSLMGFNVGVEIGQLIIVALIVPLAYAARTRVAYRQLAVAAGSVAIGFIAFGWLVERAFAIPFMPL